jgi:hypothetical protein
MNGEQKSLFFWTSKESNLEYFDIDCFKKILKKNCF